MPDRSHSEPLRRAAEHALAYLDALDAAPVGATASAEALRRNLGGPLPELGSDAVEVIDDLVRGVRGGITGSAGGRFFGWVIGGTVPAALAADWLASTWDQNAALFACAPAAAIAEEVCGAWLKDALGLPARASFALVTGCQMAHVTCLAAARNGLLAEHGWDVEAQGLCGAPALKIVTSDQLHSTLTRAARLLGLGADNVVTLPAGEAGQLSAEDLAAALEAREGRPTVVALQAGEINLGAFDPFEQLVPVAREHGAWVHVDGAFGLWAAVSPRHRELTAGVAHADSWATDGHKWLNVPYDCGYAFVARPDPHRSAMQAQAPYVTHAQDARDEMDWNPEWSRRARGFATYAALRQLGRRGLVELVEGCCDRAQDLVRRLGELEGAERVGRSHANQGLVRFLDPAPNATDADHDRRTDAVIEQVHRSGEAFFTGTTWRGRRCMRVSVSSWRTTRDDVDRAVAAVCATLGRARGGG